MKERRPSTLGVDFIGILLIVMIVQSCEQKRGKKSVDGSHFAADMCSNMTFEIIDHMPKTIAVEIERNCKQQMISI